MNCCEPSISVASMSLITSYFVEQGKAAVGEMHREKPWMNWEDGGEKQAQDLLCPELAAPLRGRPCWGMSQAVPDPMGARCFGNTALVLVGKGPCFCSHSLEVFSWSRGGVQGCYDPAGLWRSVLAQGISPAAPREQQGGPAPAPLHPAQVGAISEAAPFPPTQSLVALATLLQLFWTQKRHPPAAFS